MNTPLLKGQFNFIDVTDAEQLELLISASPPDSFSFLAISGGRQVYRIDPEAYRQWKARVIEPLLWGDPTMLLENDMAGQYIVFSHASGCTVTIPDSLLENRVFYFRARGGNVTLVGGGDLTIEPPKGGTAILEPGDSVQVNTIYDYAVDHLTVHLIGSTQLAP